MSEIVHIKKIERKKNDIKKIEKIPSRAIALLGRTNILKDISKGKVLFDIERYITLIPIGDIIIYLIGGIKRYPSKLK